MGAGRIAQGFDEPGAERVQTLAHAVSKLPQLQLGGFYDVLPDRADSAERKWNCPPSPRDREAWLDSSWDVVLIATPDDAHVADLESVLQRQPMGVMVEKPLAPDAAAAARLLGTARDQSTPVLVNFPRRWHSGIQHVSCLLASGQLGSVRRIHGTCSGGLRHNGVHLLDLVAAWCPAIQAVRLIAKEGEAGWFNFFTPNGPVEFTLSSSVQESCSVWELRLETDRARVDLCDAPEILRIARPAPHPTYPTYQALIAERTWSMEDEPLLVHMLGHLTSMIADVEIARAQVALELERERFFGEVLRHFDN